MGMVGRNAVAAPAGGTTSATEMAVMLAIVFMIIPAFCRSTRRRASTLAPAVVDIEVHPFREQYRMLLVADDLRLDEHVAIARVVQLYHAVDLDHSPQL